MFAEVGKLFNLECKEVPWRLTNVLFGVGNVVLLSSLTDAWSALNIALLPVSFFSHGLYYTDAGSLFFVLLGWYLATRRERHILASFAFLISLLFRQTNVAWLFCTMGIVTVHHLEKKSRLAMNPSLQSLSSKTVKAGIVNTVHSGIRHCPSLLLHLSPYLVVLSLFIAAVLKNGGIALGTH